MTIYLPVALMSGIGLLAGVILAVASAVMAVPKNELAEQLEEVLPGANCGACGYSGCSGYAEALSSDENVSMGLCSPGGQDAALDIAYILGKESEGVSYKTALVQCMGSYENTSDKMNYDGIHSCSASTFLAGGITSCFYGCMGMGDCEAACEYGAVKICNGVALIDPYKCTGCSKCVQSCPKNLIKFVSYKKQAVVRCSSCDKAKNTMDVCKIGCIGCRRCEKTCKYDAVTVKDNCAYVDAEKCAGCGDCVDVCPRSTITMMEAVNRE